MAEDNPKPYLNVNSIPIQMTEDFRLINKWESDLLADSEEILEESRRGLSYERANR